MRDLGHKVAVLQGYFEFVVPHAASEVPVAVKLGAVGDLHGRLAGVCAIVQRDAVRFGDARSGLDGIRCADGDRFQTRGAGRNTQSRIRDRQDLDMAHRRAHCGQDLRHIFGDLSRSLCIGIIAPDAEHGTGRLLLERGAGKYFVIPVFRIGSARLPPIRFAQHIVEVAMRIDHRKAHIGQIRCGSHFIAAPAGGPVRDRDIRIERAVDGALAIVNAVVEGHRRHAGFFDQRRQTVHIGNKAAVLSDRLQLTKAHTAVGTDVVGVFIAAHVEDGAALAGKILDVLVHQRLREADRRGVGHIDRRTGTIVCRTLNA